MVLLIQTDYVIKNYNDCISSCNLKLKGFNTFSLTLERLNSLDSNNYFYFGQIDVSSSLRISSEV